jgi:hypothetical protein
MLVLFLIVDAQTFLNNITMEIFLISGKRIMIQVMTFKKENNIDVILENRKIKNK